MDIFPKIAKTLLYSIILIIIYTFIVDYGKSFMLEAHNNFIARNAASYVSKFTVNEKDLLDFKRQSITAHDAETALVNYFQMMYDNVDGYRQTSYTSSGNRFKIIYSPDSSKSNEQGIIIVRGQLEGFDGSSTHGLPAGVGLITINIEQKQPSGLRNMVLSGGNSNIASDNDGMLGYYSIIVAKAFTVNTLKKYDE